MIKKILFSMFVVIVLLASTKCYAATRTISDAGGNWNSTLAWDEGAVPVLGDDVVAQGDGTSGNITINVDSECTSIDLTNYTGTWTASANLTVNGSLKFVPAMTWNANTYTVTLTATGNFDSGNKNFYNITTVGAITTTVVTYDMKVANVLNLASGSTLAGTPKTLELLNTTGTATPLIMTGATVATGNLSFYNQTASLTINIPSDGTYTQNSHQTFYSKVTDGTFQLTGNTTSSGAYVQFLADNTKNVIFNTQNYDYNCTTAYWEIGNSGGYTGNITINAGTSDLTLGYVKLGTSNAGTHNLNIGAGTVLMKSGPCDFTNGTGDITLSDTGCVWTLQDTVTTHDFGSETFNSMIIDGAITLAQALDINGYLTINNTKTLAAGGYQINVAGNWTNNGTFTSNSNTCIFDGTNQTFAGSTTFYTFQATTGNRTLTFTAGTTQTVTNSLTFNGSAGNQMTLRSSSTGSDWNLAMTGATQSIQYVTVSDSDASTGNQIAANDGTNVDNGMNKNWFFGRVGKSSGIISTDF